MKKFLKIITIGCLGIFSLFVIFLFILFYPVIFPDTPEEIERKKIEKKLGLKEEIEKKNIDDYITEFNIKPNHKNSKFNNLITEFNNQKNRLEFNDCEFSYNDKSFFLKDTPEQIIFVFGNPDKTRKTVTYRYPEGTIKCFDNSFSKGKLSFQIYDYPDKKNYGNVLWNEHYENTPFKELLKLDQKELKELQQKQLAKLKAKYGDSFIKVSDEIKFTYKALRIKPIFHRSKNSEKYSLTDLNIELTPYIHSGDPDVPYKIIMFRGIPYKTYTDMYDFLDLSSLTRKDLNYHRIYIYEKECFQSNNNLISTHIESKPYFETSGGGHLTWTGPYNPNKSLPIDYMNFSINSLDDLKRHEIKKAGLLD